MNLGLGHKFDILQQSPHDFEPAPPESAEPVVEETRWVPSHYNVRATTTDGRLVLWNTFNGAMSVFDQEQKPLVEALLSPKGFDAPLDGGVKYLHDRGYLLREGVDEYKRFQLAFGHQQYRTDILQLMLLASEDCNFRCTYCYEKFARGTMRPWVREGIKNLVQQRIDSGIRILSVSWFGGEPLYGLPAIEDLGPFLHETAEEHDLIFESAMTTNGYLLTPEVADKLLSWRIRKFQITLDGLAETHDQSRPTRDGRGTFATILSNLKAMRSRTEEFEIDLRVNFDRNNGHHLHRFLDLVETEFRGDSRYHLRFRAVGKWGGDRDAELNTCGKKESQDLYLQIKEEALRRGLQLTDDDDLRKLRGVRSPWVCYAARPYHMLIGASGKVMKCTIDLDTADRNVVGQITEAGRLEIDQDKFAMWTEPAFEQDTKCQKCLVLPICHGISCPQVRIRNNVSPCLSFRSSLKKELRAVAGVAPAKRTVRVDDSDDGRATACSVRQEGTQSCSC